MKWKKVMSGILAFAMVVTSVVTTTPTAAFASEGKISVAEITYTPPEEGKQPGPVTVEVGEEDHHKAVIDSAKDPVTIVRADDASTDSGSVVLDPVENELKHFDGSVGFNAALKGRMEGDASESKFNIYGDSQMVISFQLYLDTFPQSNEYIISKGDQYSIQLTNNGLLLTMKDELGNLVRTTFSGCFTDGENRWYDVIAVIDARNSGKSRLFVNEQVSEMTSHANIDSTNDPFAFCCQVKDDAVTGVLAKEHAYLAEIKFYNGSKLGSDFQSSLNLNSLAIQPNGGLSELQKLMDSVEPTAMFSLNPYDVKTVWNPTGDGAFQCGTPYKAVTTIKAHNGYTFDDSNINDIQFTSGYTCSLENKVGIDQIDLDNTAADCEHPVNSQWEGTNGPDELALDGDEKTYWHSQYSPSNPVNLANGVKNGYTITFKEKTLIGMFGYLPIQQNKPATKNGTIKKFSLKYKEEISDNDDDWKTLVENGIWENTTDWKYADEFAPVMAKQIRIEVASVYGNDGNCISAAEFAAYEAKPVVFENDATKAELNNDKTVMTITTDYPAIDCKETISNVDFGSSIILTKGTLEDRTYEIKPSVKASDGRLIDEHPGLSVEKDKIQYSYQTRAEDKQSDTTLITVKDGVVTASETETGNAWVIATATLNDTEIGSREIFVKVLEENREIGKPDVYYKSPAADSYPEIATIKLDDSSDHRSVLLDAAEGGSELTKIDDSEEVIEPIDGIMGFVGGYKASNKDQFNVTGNHPLVITLKLHLDHLLAADSRGEHVILSKGNQYHLTLKNNNGTTKLVLGSAGANGLDCVCTLTEDFLTKKWHDIVIVADGKGNRESFALFVDGTYYQAGATGSIPNGSQYFEICNKDDNYTDFTFTKDDGRIAAFRFFDIEKVDPSGELAELINVKQLGTDNAAAIIQTLLESKKPTAHITAAPFTVETVWYLLDGKKELPIEGIQAFSDAFILEQGYLARTTIRPFAGFAFSDSINTEKAKDWIHLDPELNAAMYDCIATLQSGGDLELKTFFYPRRIPVQEFTYPSPAAATTAVTRPRYVAEEVEKYMSVSDTKWLKNGTDPITAGEFEQISKNPENWYRAESVLTAKDDYRFENIPAYLDEVKKNISTQLSGDVNADVNVTFTSASETEKEKLTIQIDYKDPIYSVTFYSDDAMTEVFNTQSVSEGRFAAEPKNKPENSSEDITFAGWYAKDAEEEYDFSTPVTGDVQLAAKWDKYHTVTFHPNKEGLEDIEQRVVKGRTAKTPEEITIPDGVEIEWYSDQTLETKFDLKTVITKDMDLYARWIAKVIFISEEGGDIVKEVAVDLGGKLKETDLAAPAEVNKVLEEKKGSTIHTHDEIEGWYYEEGGAKYTDEDAFHTRTYLYPKWKVHKHGVVFELNGGSWPDGYGDYPKEVEHGASLSINPEKNPTKTDVTFGGWFTDEECKALYQGEAVVPAEINDVFTLYAKWIVHPVTVTYTYDKQEVTDLVEINPSSQIIEENETVGAAPRVVRAHWDVAGWYTDEGEEFKFGSDGTLVTENITLHAKWQRKKYTVRFDTNDGSTVEPLVVDSESTIADNQMPTSTKDGFELEGWYKDRNLRSKFVPGTDRITENNTILYARWIDAVTGVTLSPTELNMEVGDAPVQLTASIQPPSASQGRTVVWSTSDPDVATVSLTGEVTAVGEGIATITATVKSALGDKTATATVNVSPQIVAKRDSLQAEHDLVIKDYSGDVGTDYSTRRIMTVRNQKYDDPAYGAVGEGLLEQAKGDDAAISFVQFDLSQLTKAEKNDMRRAVLRLYVAGGKTACSDNTLKAAVVPPESGLTDLAGNNTWTAIYTSVHEWLSAKDENNQKNRFALAGESAPYAHKSGENMDITKLQENPPVEINIDITETVQAMKDTSGKLILALNETKNAEHYFITTEGVRGVTGVAAFQGATEEMIPSIRLFYKDEVAEEVVVTPQTATLKAKDETLQMSAIVMPQSAVDKTVTWTSSAPAIATVSETGLVTAISNGDATITARANGTAADTVVKGEAQIKVAIPCSCEIGELTVSGGSIQMSASDESATFELKPSAAAKNEVECEISGHPGSNEITYSYALGNKNTAEATVDPATGVVTVTKAGEVEIAVTAALADGAAGHTSVTETVTITVTKAEAGQSVIRYHANTDGHDTEVAGLPENQIVDDGYELAEPGSPTWTGHTFKHWSKTADGEAVEWPQTISADADFYAVWTSGSGEEISCSCEIGELTVTGSSILIGEQEDSASITLGASASVKNSGCLVSGHPDGNTITYSYALGNKNTAGATVDPATGVVTVTKAGEVEIAVTAALTDGAAGHTSVTETVTITVTKAEAGQSVIRYHANTDGYDTEVAGMPENQIVDDGYELAAPKSPTWTGHTFKHWSKTADGEAVEWPQTINADADFYAIWTSSGDDNTDLESLISEMRELYEIGDIYTVGWNSFVKAYEEAAGDISKLTPEQKKDLAKRLKDAADALTIDNTKLETVIVDGLKAAQEEIEIGGNPYYTVGSWGSYEDAYKLLRDTAATEGGADPAELLGLYRSMIRAKIGFVIDRDWVAAKAALEKALRDAAGIYAAGAAGQDAKAWNTFKAAYDAANDKKDAIAGNSTADQLNKLAIALNAARNAMSGSLTVGAYVDLNGIRYVVTNAASKTVSAQGLDSAKKSLKKAKIEDEVKVNGVTCTVTEIKAGAFKQFANLKTVVIGKNVSTIGKQAFFKCKKLKKVTFKNTEATVINAKAFKGTKATIKVILPKKMKANIKKKMKTVLKKKGKISGKAKIK